MSVPVVDLEVTEEYGSIVVSGPGTYSVRIYEIHLLVYGLGAVVTTLWLLLKRIAG